MTTENNLPKVTVPTTGATPSTPVKPEVQNTAVITAIPTAEKFKATFQHSIPMSSFYFRTGRAAQFRGGFYHTNDDTEIAELRAVCATNPMILEVGEDGVPLKTNEDVQREQAAKLL